MSYSGRVKRGGSDAKNHGKKESKSKKGIDVSELANFRYERPAPQPVSQRSGRKYIPRSSVQQVSKAQFVQAHFRFLLSPLTNPLEPCLYEPDTIVPWQFISCVILPPPLKRGTNGHDPAWGIEGSPAMSVADYEAGDLEHSIMTCPICLDDVQIPRITSCGHTFCYTCILRHLYSELSNANKCPICAVSMCASDLKTVLHYADKLHAIFSTNSPTTPSAINRTVSVSEGLSVGQDAEFKLLQVNKGSIVPLLHTSLAAETADISSESVVVGNTSKLSLTQVLPVCTAECAPYNRLSCLTMDMIRQLFAYEKEQLLAYRRRCLPPDASTRNKTSTSTTIKGSTAQTTSTTASPPLAWGAKSFASTIAGNTPTDTISTGANAAAGGDVEALPYIQLALERQQQAEHEFAAKLVQRAMVTNLMGEHNSTTSAATTSTTALGSAPIRSAVPVYNRSSADATDSTAVAASTTGRDGGVAKQDKSVYHIYQHPSGALIFLHPICTKCLLEAHSSETLSLANNGASHNAIKSPTGSPRTHRKHTAAAPPVDTSPPAAVAVDVGESALAERTFELSVSNINTSTATTAVTNTSATAVPPHIASYKPTIRGMIIDIDSVRVTAELRQRYNVLRHLPVHSEVLLLEIDLHDMVPAHVLCKYAEELHKRAAKRKERARQEKREKRLDQDRSMAEALLAQERHDYLMAQRAEENYRLQQLLQGPSLDVYSGNSTSTGTSNSVVSGDSYHGQYAHSVQGSDVYRSASEGNAVYASNVAAVSTQSNVQAEGSAEASKKSVSSFATITQMGGNFPTLGQAVKGPTTKSSGGSVSNTTVWGTAVKSSAVPVANTTSSTVFNMSAGGGAGKSVNTSNVTSIFAETDAQPPPPQSQQAHGSGNGKKGNKKTKIVLVSSLRMGR